jgi:hypothetical protein
LTAFIPKYLKTMDVLSHIVDYLAEHYEYFRDNKPIKPETHQRYFQSAGVWLSYDNEGNAHVGAYNFNFHRFESCKIPLADPDSYDKIAQAIFKLYTKEKQYFRHEY